MLYRLQASFKHISGLPRDNVTNTFWVEDDQADWTQPTAEALAEAIRDFYVVNHGVGGHPLHDHLGRAIVTDGHEVKATPIVKATGLDARGLGFPPLHTEVFSLVGRTVEVLPNPHEVALCLSFKNLASGGVPPAQRRGRIYFGPIGGSQVVLNGDVTIPSADLRNDLLRAATWLRDTIPGAGRDWVIYSRPYPGRPETERPGNPRGPLPALAARAGATYVVTDLWVDNAFDTQRKRGEKATSRLVA